MVADVRLELGKPDPLSLAWGYVLERYGYFCKPGEVVRREGEVRIEVLARVPIKFTETDTPLMLELGQVGSMSYRAVESGYALERAPSLPSLLGGIRSKLDLKRKEIDITLVKSSKGRFGRIQAVRYPFLSVLTNLAEALREQCFAEPYGKGFLPMDQVIQIDKNLQQYTLLVESGLAQRIEKHGMAASMVPTEEFRLLLDRSKENHEQFLSSVTGYVIGNQYDRLVTEFHHPIIKILTRTASALYERSFVVGKRVSIHPDQLVQAYKRRNDWNDKLVENIRWKYIGWLTDAKIFEATEGTRGSFGKNVRPAEDIYDDFCREMERSVEYRNVPPVEVYDGAPS